MALTKTQTIGFCEAVIDFVETNREALANRGANIDQLIADLRGETEAAMNASSEHETLKAKMRISTAKTEALLKSAYYNASSKVDTIAGMYGKTTEMGRQTARLRSTIARAARKTVTAGKDAA
ncbi:MAG: hypothetical protein HZC28_07545 [Spirochaetes bacterium]|nr:hypothetical protein [Spirochaetota bacterium]